MAVNSMKVNLSVFSGGGESVQRWDTPDVRLQQIHALNIRLT